MSPQKGGITCIPKKGTISIGNTLPETNIAPEMDGWNTSFLLGWPILRCELLVSGRVQLPTIDFQRTFLRFEGRHLGKKLFGIVFQALLGGGFKYFLFSPRRLGEDDLGSFGFFGF